MCLLPPTDQQNEHSVSLNTELIFFFALFLLRLIQEGRIRFIHTSYPFWLQICLRLMLRHTSQNLEKYIDKRSCWWLTLTFCFCRIMKLSIEIQVNKNIYSSSKVKFQVKFLSISFRRPAPSLPSDKKDVMR